MLKSIPSTFALCAVAALGIILSPFAASAATIAWSGASGAGTNWSDGGNWFGGVAPAGGDDVRFFDFGTNNASTQIGVANGLVDAGFTTAIGSLQFANTNGIHTVAIASGVSLWITNGNLVVGSTNDLAIVKSITNAFTGAGGTLVVSNPAAVISIQQGTATAVNGSRGNLNLSGLDNFVANVKAIGLGSTVFVNPGNANQREAGSLILAKTNVITLALTDTLANYQTAGKTNAIELSRNPGNNSAIHSVLLLGQSSILNVDSMAFGRDKASASSAGIMLFNPLFTNNNPVAVFRGAAGGSSRVTWWAIGDMNANASSAQLSIGTNDFSNGTVDALVDTMSLGRDCSPQHTASGFNVGVLTFNAGTIDVNTLLVGNQALGPITSFAGQLGIVNVLGSTAKLVVNNTLELGHTTVAFVPGTGGTNAAKTFGVLNIRNGGTVLANRIIAGAASTNLNAITINSGTLVVSNNVGTPTKSIYTFAATNSTLRLNITGITNIFCTNLVSSGATNNITLESVAIFPTYPKQVVLIKYTTQLGLGVTNFGLTSIPASAPGAYLSNNIANSSLDLVLPFDPRPIITTQPASYSGNPGDNVGFSVVIDANSATPLTYQWYLGATPVANGATGNGSTNFGSTTASLGITNAQSADNGNYTVVVNNAYGSATSTPPAVLTISAGNIAPSITGPANQTVIQGNNGTFTASVSGNPAPALQWQRNGVDILNETNSSYTLVNAQYPTDDGVVFTLIATNIAGSATNSATLTVIVPPVITTAPVSLVVTSTQAASFSVAATGVPVPTYQWFFNNSPISGETNTTLNIASATSANTGTYRVLVNNAAGSTNSVNVTLTVNSTMSPVTLSPSNNATGICYDTPLAITFSSAPLLGAAGTIKIYNVTNAVTPVDTISVALGANQQRSFPSDGQSFTYQTIQISGSTAKIYPHFSVLTSNQTYFVTIDAGAFTDTTGALFTGITSSNVWFFATKVGGPADPTNPIVNLDGSGDYLTVQGAVNALPTGTNAVPRVINIRDGLYNEIVDIAGRHNVTLRGQSRTGAVIVFANNATFQTANGGTTHARMTFKVNANDIVLDTLTVSNSTPQGGSQAEALMIESNAKRGMVLNCEIASRQDTILGNQNSSQTYFYGTLVKGNFDYVWGGGNFYFDQCEIRTVTGTGNANFSAARTDTAPTQSANFPWQNPGGNYTANGMSFVNCAFTAEVGVGPVTLAGGNGTAANNVSWVGCDFATNYVAPSAALFSGNFLFWQKSNTMTNAPVTFAVLTTIGVTNNDTRLLAATNITTWFYGWGAGVAPTIVTNPMNQTVTAGQAASFGVLATGIPAPSYQWQHAGTNLPGANSSVVSLPVATADLAGAYACIVTTPAGSATSSTATLTVNPLTITVTADGQTKVYGAADPALTYNSTPALLMGDSFSGALSRAAGSSVGSYAIGQGTLSLNANYSITFVTGSNLVITAAALGITANNTNKVFGATVTFVGTEFNSSGLIGGDSVGSVTLTSSGAPSGAAAGSYSIVPSAATGSGLGNYTITYNNGTLTVSGSPDSSFTNIVANPGGSVSVTFTGSDSLAYRIQSATDLVSPTWVDVSTNTVSGGSATFTDTNTTDAIKFYRVVYP